MAEDSETGPKGSSQHESDEESEIESEDEPEEETERFEQLDKDTAEGEVTAMEIEEDSEE